MGSGIGEAEFLQNMFERFYDHSTGKLTTNFAAELYKTMYMESMLDTLGGSSTGYLNVTGSIYTSDAIVAGTRVSSGVVALTLVPATLPDTIATIATDASLGNLFTITMSTTGSFLAPTNPVDGQVATWRWTNSSATRPQLATFSVGGTLDFRFPAAGISLLPTNVAKTDYVTAIYNGTDGKWDIVRLVQGL